jgi:hypothetical protein
VPGFGQLLAVAAIVVVVEVVVVVVVVGFGWRYLLAEASLIDTGGKSAD